MENNRPSPSLPLPKKFRNLSDFPDSTDLLSKLIRDKKKSDRDVASWLRPEMSMPFLLNFSEVDEATDMPPLMLAAYYARPLTVEALLRRGADPWSHADCWPMVASQGDSLPIVRDALIAMAPGKMKALQSLDGKPGFQSTNPNGRNEKKAEDSLPFTQENADRDLAWFGLAEACIQSSVRCLSSHPKLVEDFLTSLLPLWSSRPWGVGHSWVEVMTSALDSMVISWQDHPAQVRFRENFFFEDYEKAIDFLVDLGADPNTDRLVTDVYQTDMVWSNLLGASLYTANKGMSPSLLAGRGAYPSCPSAYECLTCCP